MKSCHGNGKTHCCSVDGVLCPFLEEHTVEGRRWVCGLFRELGSWRKVEQDPRWQENVGVSFKDGSRGSPTYTCGTWPFVLPDETILYSMKINGGTALCCFGDNNPEVSCEEAKCGC